MQYSTNYNMNKPELNDQYDVDHWNENTDILDTELKKRENDDNALKNPTYTVAASDANLVSGEDFKTAFGKIAKAISSFITHKATETSVHGSTPNNTANKIVERNADGRCSVSQPDNIDQISNREFSEKLLSYSNFTNVHVATTANITLSGEQIIDGYSTVAGNLVLVKNQTDSKENGIWECQTGVWNRSADFDSDSEIRYKFISVLNGTVSKNKIFKVVSDTITIGTSLISFVEYPISLNEESASVWRHKFNAGPDLLYPIVINSNRTINFEKQTNIIIGTDGVTVTLGTAPYIGFKVVVSAGAIGRYGWVSYNGSIIDEVSNISITYIYTASGWTPADGTTYYIIRNGSSSWKVHRGFGTYHWFFGYGNAGTDYELPTPYCTLSKIDCNPQYATAIMEQWNSGDSGSRVLWTNVNHGSDGWQTWLRHDPKRPAIGVPTMWFGSKPSWALGFADGAQYLWATYPELNNSDFKKNLDAFISYGLCTAYNSTKFNVPNLNGLTPKVAGTSPWFHHEALSIGQGYDEFVPAITGQFSKFMGKDFTTPTGAFGYYDIASQHYREDGTGTLSGFDFDASRCNRAYSGSHVSPASFGMYFIVRFE